MTIGRDRLEDLVNRSWYGGSRWTYVFLPVVPLVAFVVWWRRRFRPRARFAELGAPVIVVGGLTAGGTGKTPTLIALARYFAGRSFRVGIISRGYGRKTTQSTIFVEAEHHPDEVGDEPLLIKQSAPSAAVVVAISRVEAARSLCREHGVEIVLSDDGLQHYALPRDFEIAVVDSERRSGNGCLIPVGPLREPIARLQSVDFVLERNGPDTDSALIYRPEGFYRLDGSGAVPASEASYQWRGKAIVAATGLGQPSQFFKLLNHLGLKFENVTVADHAQLNIAAIKKEFNPDVIVVTAKDAVKLDVEECDNVWTLEIEAALPDSLYLAIERCLERDAI